MTFAPWMEFLFSMALRSVPLAGAGVLFYLAVRRGPGPLRFAAALGAIVCLASLPLILLFVPKFNWAIVSRGFSPVVADAMAMDFRFAFVATWLSGVTLFLIRFLRITRSARRLIREADECCDANAVRTLESLKRRFAIRVPVRLANSTALSRPVLCGLLQPLILLPQEAATWSAARLEFVLAHELAHVARRDLWSQWLCQAVCACYWFNPMVWWLAKWQVREREIGADERALSITGDNRTGYARELLAIATETGSQDRATPLPCAAAMIGATSKLEDRISCLFADRSKRRLNRLFLALACLVALVILAACAAFDPVATNSPDPWNDQELRLRLSANPFPGS